MKTSPQPNEPVLLSEITNFKSEIENAPAPNEPVKPHFQHKMRTIGVPIPQSGIRNPKWPGRQTNPFIFRLSIFDFRLSIFRPYGGPLPRRFRRHVCLIG